MLPVEENELMCRVGPGTPMGEVLRHYWLPVFFPSELTPDGPPLRTRLLGEDLVAFRATSGKISLVQNACPHRGASLFLLEVRR
jgi:phenylpropionate dioxygenase-like ring-hydroxylating dioxygenase large terminal subunit